MVVLLLNAEVGQSRVACTDIHPAVTSLIKIVVGFIHYILSSSSPTISVGGELFKISTSSERNVVAATNKVLQRDEGGADRHLLLQPHSWERRRRCTSIPHRLRMITIKYKWACFVSWALEIIYVGIAICVRFRKKSNTATSPYTHDHHHPWSLYTGAFKQPPFATRECPYNITLTAT